MMMKKSLLMITLLLVTSVGGRLTAQTLSAGVQTVYDACLKLSTSVGAGNTAGLRAASKTLKQAGVGAFTTLHSLDKDVMPLDGHFVFDAAFVDSLVAGRDVYRFAQRYADEGTVRASASSGKVFVKTCAVRKQSSARFTFMSRGPQQLAVVAEPGGRITLRIHDKTHDKWYNDTKDVRRGRLSRCSVFELPANVLSTLEVEVINCGKKDVSFVVISN